ncbi:unnamed protein product [Closterium sp. NIES-54]
MATPRVLRFDAEGRPLEFSVWLLRARRLLESQVQANETLWAHTSSYLPEPADPTPLATDPTPVDSDRYARGRADSEETHFTQVCTASEFLTTIKARYATPTSVSLGRLFLPFLFLDLASFERTADLITHMRSLDSSYRAASIDAQLALLPPPMAITIYFIATSLPDRLASVRDALLLKHPSKLTIELLESALKDVESNLRSVASASGAVPPPLFHKIGRRGGHGASGGDGGGGGDVASGGDGSAGVGGAPCAAAGDSPAAAGGGDARVRQPPTGLPAAWGGAATWYLTQRRLHATPHSSSLRPTTKPFETLHLDVWGPASRPGPERESLFLVVVDDYSRYTTVFPLAKKSDVNSTLIRWLLTTADTHGRHVSYLHSDREGGFRSSVLAGFCREQGIRQSWMLPESPQRNGVAERRIGLVMETTRTSMIQARASYFLWPYAVRTRLTTPSPQSSSQPTADPAGASFQGEDPGGASSRGAGVGAESVPVRGPSSGGVGVGAELVTAGDSRLRGAVVSGAVPWGATTGGAPFAKPREPRTDPVNSGGAGSGGGVTGSLESAARVGARGERVGAAAAGATAAGGAAAEAAGAGTTVAAAAVAAAAAGGAAVTAAAGAAAAATSSSCLWSSDPRSPLSFSSLPPLSSRSGAVSWRSTCSSSVSTSTAEAEIYARAIAAQELRWLTFLLADLGERPSSALTLFIDNKATILLCQEPRLESRVKHINVRFFLLRELQRRGQARFDFVESEANTADIFTKALSPCDHQRCCVQLGLVDTGSRLA